MQHKHIPSKLSSTCYNVPWLTTKLKRMCRKKRRLFRRAKKSTNPTHKAAYKHIQNETLNALRRAHWSYVNGILAEGLAQGDMKPFHGYIKSQHQDNQGVSPLRERGQLYSDAHSKAHILSEQFRSVFTRDAAQSSAKRLAGPAHPPAEPLTINEDGVQKLLAGLNPQKASGPDEVPARILGALATEVAPALTFLYQQSIETGEIPSQWRKAWITPVFKKGGRADAANYHPVSLTSIACKLLEHIFCSHVRRHLDNHKILCENNHGFRAKHSRETQLLLTTHEMLKLRDTGKQLDVVILDFSKAFDKVPHRRLQGILDFYGIRGNLLIWAEAFLIGRTQSVLVDGIKSKEEDVHSGVPQGTVLGPPLWITNQYGRDISVTSLLTQLRLESLEERRRICRLTFMYKILNQHVAVSPSDLDLLYNTRPVRGSVTTKRLRTIRCRQTAYQESFAPKTVVQWNTLKDTITSAASVPSFRSQLATKTRP